MKTNLPHGFSDANSIPAIAVGGEDRELSSASDFTRMKIVKHESGIGDVNSSERGSGARFNSGKAAVDLIPLRLIADSIIDPARGIGSGYVMPAHIAALYTVGEFQEGGDARVLKDALRTMSPFWIDCARVFDYGRRKYAAWNWAKGMSWSAVIGCIGRHALAIANGEARDIESGERHEGHILCNLVMLATYVDTYPEGNDLPPPGLFKPATDKPTPVDDHVERHPRLSVVIYGPQACGKTRNAKFLAAYFGLETIVDDWDGKPFASIDTLVLTNDRSAFDAVPLRRRKMTFNHAMRLMTGAAE